jgi:7-cyano-7-deazaguanine synthase
MVNDEGIGGGESGNGESGNGESGGLPDGMPGTIHPGKKNRAVVLLSGGLGSYVAAAKAKAAGMQLYALTVNYGQLATAELEAAGKIGQALGVLDHALVTLNLRGLAPAPLTGAMPLPDGRLPRDIMSSPASSYVPGRNLLLLSLAATHGEALGADGLVVGFDADMAKISPDCRPDMLRAFAAMMGVGTMMGATGRQFMIAAPVDGMAKADVVRAGRELGLDFSLPVSCHRLD